jgi:hypothetical protein
MTLSAAVEAHIVNVATVAERLYHEAHRISAHNGAQPEEIGALTIAMASLWHTLPPANAST